MLSPHHADCDYRVRRVINVMHEMGLGVDIYWDSRYPGHQERMPFEDHVRELYRENLPGERKRRLLGRPFLHSDIETAVRQSDIVYVNASAIDGLLYARESKRLNPQCKVVYDYHDSLTYELYYQMTKRGLGFLYKFVWPVYKMVCARLARHVDALVGISTKQVDEFPRSSGRMAATASIPNYRTFDDFKFAPEAPDEAGESSLVWLGQVMRGRDLEKLSGWISRVGTSRRFHVFGKVIDDAASDIVFNQLDGNVSFYGEFKNETDILKRIPPAPVGVFLGWNDPARTNINAHASPNKYFTYVNMGIPVIIASSLSELARHVAECGAGLAVADEAEFAVAVAEIEANYDAFAAGALRLKEKYRQAPPEKTIQVFLEETINMWRR